MIFDFFGEEKMREGRGNKQDKQASLFWLIFPVPRHLSTSLILVFCFYVTSNMAAVRLRKAFRYPEESDDDDREELDEEEQERVIQQLQQQNESRNAQYSVYST